MKTLVVYYSRKGSNSYLAQKIAQSLSCDMEEIKPRINLFMLFLMNIHLGIRPLKKRISEYDRVILCGPIWMGKFIPPLRSFMKMYGHQINSLVFVSCCGSTFKGKDDKFGHGLVFKELKEMYNDKPLKCQAFPIGLVLPEGQKEDSDAYMKTHLNDENFQGEIQVLYGKFLGELVN
jgi:menaquinone-dependent protoporphyrinogen IX oxidase